MTFHTKYQSFKVRSYLDSRGISYQEEGKNISDGWIGIECPFCPDGDPSNHLGINIISKNISCWRCPASGSVLKLIKKLEPRLSKKALSELVNQFSDREIPIDEPTEINIKRSMTSDAITDSIDELLPLHRGWLDSRNFDPEYIFKKYGLKCFGPIGKYKHRLLIPYYRHKRIITFTTRDVTNLSKTPYMHCPTEESVVEPKRYLYNLDTVKDTAIIVEGPTDVWRIGDGCVATMGITFMVEQLVLLKLRKVQRAFFMFDFEKFAQDSAENFSFAASTFIPHVEVLELDEGDPADLTTMDVKAIRRDIFGKNF